MQHLLGWTEGADNKKTKVELNCAFLLARTNAMSESKKPVDPQLTASKTYSSQFSQVEVNSLPRLEEMCHDFSQLLNPLPTPGIQQQVSSLEKSVQSTLERLDEFSAFTESLRSSTYTASSSLLPAIQSRAQEIELLFTKIDEFQDYLNAVELSVSRMENRAEHVSSTFGGTKITKLFSSFMNRLSNDKPKNSPFYWPPVDYIERTGDHFST